VAGSVGTTLKPARAHVTGPARQAAAALVDELYNGLGDAVATAVLYFASSSYDLSELAGPISEAFPDAAVIGCSTAGEFTDRVMGTGGISAVALPYGMLTGAVAALADLSQDPVAGMQAAVRALEASLEVPLRDLDPANHLGLILIDGLSLAEEVVSQVLGDAAPLLDVVGGSAGDDLAFRTTRISVGPHVGERAAALLICQTGVPFQVIKTCSFVSTGRTLRITDVDVAGRTVHTIEGRPAVEAYADALGVPVGGLDAGVWLRHPVGLMIRGEPWIRAPQAVLPNGGITFFAQILPGMQVEVMQATDLIADTRAAVATARDRLGGGSGAVMFNCVLRRVELDRERTGASFLRAFGGLPLAGFHTYGETWLGHVNQTMTGVVFG